MQTLLKRKTYFIIQKKTILYDKLQNKASTFNLNVKAAFVIHTCKNKRKRI